MKPENMGTRSKVVALALAVVVTVSLPFLWLHLSRTYGFDPNEWERILTRTWFYLTPLTLNLAALVMGVLLAWRGRWRNRMARASFGLVLSYALIMDRFLYLNWSQTDALPQPWALMLWSVAFVAVVYFLYALLVEWVLPFGVYIWRAIFRHQGGKDA